MQDKLVDIARKNLIRLTKKLEELEVDGSLITWEGNVFYLTGLPKPSGSYLLLLKGEEPKLLVPALDYWRACDFTRGFEVIPYASYQLPGVGVDVLTKKLHDYIVDEITSRNMNKLGIDLSYQAPLGARTDVKARERGIEVRDIGDLLSDLRAVKQPEEVDLMRKALEVTEDALWEVLGSIKPGVREYEVAAELEYCIKSRGVGELAFGTIVASGPNAAYPHAVPSARKVREGDVIVIDVGAKYHGYCSDMTRTVAVGAPAHEVKKIIDAVDEAVNNAIDRISEGVKAEDIDEAARATLRKYGLDKYFIHSTGHGVGVEVHEKPRLGKGGNYVVKEGMIITIEPGVYLHGQYGVRIENMVLVRKNRAEVLNKKPNII